MHNPRVGLSLERKPGRPPTCKPTRKGNGQPPKRLTIKDYKEMLDEARRIQDNATEAIKSFNRLFGVYELLDVGFKYGEDLDTISPQSTMEMEYQNASDTEDDGTSSVPLVEEANPGVSLFFMSNATQTLTS